MTTKVQDLLSAIGRKHYMVIGDGKYLYDIGTGDEHNHTNIRLLLQRFENLNKLAIFKELLTKINKPAIHEHCYIWDRYMGNSC